LLRLLENLLHNLLLLNQERSHNTIPNAVGTSRSTVGTLNGLLWSGDLGVLAGSESWDLQDEYVSICLLNLDCIPQRASSAPVSHRTARVGFQSNLLTGTNGGITTRLLNLRMQVVGFPFQRLFPRYFSELLQKIEIRTTYSWQLDSAVSTLGRSSSFLDVKVSEGSAWGLDNADLV
jgi:hypothetical protein